MIKKDLLQILLCPESKARLVPDGNFLVSTDEKTRRRYKIVNDIPVMLIEESEVLPVKEWKSIMKRCQADEG